MDTTSPLAMAKWISRAANTSADFPRAANRFSTPMNSIAGILDSGVILMFLFHYRNIDLLQNQSYTFTRIWQALIKNLIKNQSKKTGFKKRTKKNLKHRRCFRFLRPGSPGHFAQELNKKFITSPSFTT
jgi:hypothetical protein